MGGSLKAEIRHFHLFAGLGGAARGFNAARARVGAWEADWRCIGGVDVDPAAARDFERLAGAPCQVLDLMGRAEYELYHGEPPPDGWREATPGDLRRAAGGERPHVIATSPPCKGFSGLVSKRRSTADRYQALNSLTLRGIMLALTAWEGDPPEVFLLENVPRIQQRGRHFLDQIIALLDGHGYATAETTYDCGEIGGLGQRRRRYLLLARHREKCPPMVFEPPVRGLRSVGEVIGGLPVPGGPLALPCGPMHDLPRLQWRTWVRLALVEAGGDWRSLRRLEIEDGMVAGVRILPCSGIGGTYGVLPWGEPSGTVTGRAMATTGKYSVADPRVAAHHGVYGVTPWPDPAPTVTGASRPTTGPYCVADPRPSWASEYGQLGVWPWDSPTGAVTGQSAPGGGRYSVADPRLPEREGRHRNKFRVGEWAEAAGSVISSTRPGSGAACIADPRLARVALNNVYRVVKWDEAAQTVTAGGTPTAGGQAVADPRPNLGGRWGAGHYGIVPWDEPAGAVTSARYDSGRASVADPRCPESTNDIGGSETNPRHDCLPGDREQGAFRIVALDGTWHRPLTTLELAYLQGLLDPGDWRPFDGSAHCRWRERIGNAVPSPAAEAIGGVVGRALLAHWSGTYLQATMEAPWCLPVVAAWEAAR